MKNKKKFTTFFTTALQLVRKPGQLLKTILPIPNRLTWKIKRGEHYTYPDKPPYFSPALGLAPIKPEGAPIEYTLDLIKYPAGYWWSVEFRVSHLVGRFRYRSWTSNIFYIAWD